MKICTCNVHDLTLARRPEMTKYLPWASNFVELKARLCPASFYVGGRYDIILNINKFRQF